MNLERGATNTLLIPGRQLTGETHYLLVFTRKENGGVAKVITTNTGKTTGPLLLQFDEVDGGVAADGDIELAAGDWQLVIYTQGNGTNLLISSTLREIWEEQIRVDGEGGDVPDPVDEGCPFDITVNVDGVFVETITDVDPCVDNTLTLNITYS